MLPSIIPNDMLRRVDTQSTAAFKTENSKIGVDIARLENII